MKNLIQFSLLVGMLTLLAACGGTGDSSAPGGPSPAKAGSPISAATSPSPSPTARPLYPGVIDTSNCESVGGWIFTTANPKAGGKVELYIDGKLVDTMQAKNLRSDLTSWGSGQYGFSFKIPAAYKDDKPHVVDVKVFSTNYSVPFFQPTSPNIQCKPS